MHTRTSLLATSFILVSTLGLNACVERQVVYRDHPVYSPPPPPRAPEIVTYVAPPPPRVEYQPPPPTNDPYWAWAPGHWRWGGQSYIWQAGHWARKPAPQQRWFPAHWQPRGNGWVFVEGRFG